MHETSPEDRKSRTPEFGALLRKLRAAAGFSQDGLAERARISVKTIGALEQGVRRAAHDDTIERIAGALHLHSAERDALMEAARTSRARRIREPRSSLPTPLPSLGERDGVQEVPALDNNRLAMTTAAPRLTSFLGRQDDIIRIKQMLQRGRLVTLTGSGGIGKTRMAVETARDLLELRQYPGASFVDFSPLRDEAFVPGAIAEALRLPAPPVANPLPSLVAALQSQAHLLILDNCEHLIEVVARTAGTLLRECPTLAILATSRERLAIEGEHVHRLPSLPVPSATAAMIDEARRFASVQLFVDRAAAAGLAEPLGVEQLKLVAEMCRRLEGIPLAIELAANRAPALGIELLERRLSEHLAISGSRRDLPQRQRTVTATVAWSYDLLSESERTLLGSLAVFRGGATLEAVEAVSADRSLTRSGILALLLSLFDKSLLTIAHNDGQPRYSMLEAVRTFLLRQLSEAGELETVTRAHLRWMAVVGGRASQQRDRVSRFDWLRDFSVELDNVREALTYALDTGDSHDAVLAGALIGDLRYLWVGTWRNEECMRWCRAALERIDEEQHPTVTANLLRAYVQSTSGREMLAVADRAFSHFARIGDGQGLMFLHANVAVEHSKMGHFDEAEEHVRRSFVHSTSRRLSVQEELALRELLCHDRIRAGRLEEARLDLQRMAQLTRNDDPDFLLCYWEGCIEFAAANYKRALDLLERNFRTDSRNQRESEATAVLSEIAATRLALGQVDVADQILSAELGRSRDAANASTIDVIYALVQHVAAVRALQGKVHRAAQLAGFIAAWGIRNERVPDIFGRSSITILENVLRRELSATTFAQLASDGATLELHHAVAQALA